MPRIFVDTPPAFRFDMTVLSHGWLQLRPFSYDEPLTTLVRVERLHDGRIVKLSMKAGSGEHIEIGVAGLPSRPAASVKEEIAATVRRIFNLDLNLSPFYERLDGLDRYEWVRALGGGRLLRAPTVWEDLAKTLMTTNTTWGMTRQIVSRINEIGDEYGAGEYAFPTPEQVAALKPDELAAQVRAGYRNAYLHELATAIAEGTVDPDSWVTDGLAAAEMFKRVRVLKGFGPYAAGSMLKLLGRFDELALDSAARSMFAREFNNGEKAPDGMIKKHYEPFGEWKGLVIWMDLMHDWIKRRMEVEEAFKSAYL